MFAKCSAGDGTTLGYVLKVRGVRFVWYVSNTYNTGGRFNLTKQTSGQFSGTMPLILKALAFQWPYK